MTELIVATRLRQLNDEYETIFLAMDYGIEMALWVAGGRIGEVPARRRSHKEKAESKRRLEALGVTDG